MGRGHGKDQTKPKIGFVVQVGGTRYVREIIANGNPENPIIYYTEDLQEAKAWQLPAPVRKAKERVRKQLPSCNCRVNLFFEKTGKREIFGALADNNGKSPIDNGNVPVDNGNVPGDGK